jgi:hypothetical protein
VVQTRFVPTIYVINHDLLKVLRLFPQTVSAIHSLFLAMTLFPDVQKKAQAEIDVVVGHDRLPSFADRDSLPYIEALVTEVMRWNVVLPTCMRISFMTLCICRRVSLYDRYPPLCD